jgi:hypothetical protein
MKRAMTSRLGRLNMKWKIGSLRQPERHIVIGARTIRRPAKQTARGMNAAG